MAEHLGPLEDQLRRDRTALGENVRELEGRLHAAVDWRTHYRAHVGAALTVAFAGGVLLGASLRNGRLDRPARALSTIDPSGRARSHVHDLWARIVDALIGVAAASVVNVVSDLVPGFRREFDAHGSDHTRSSY